MDAGDFGFGAGGSFLGSLLTYLGFKQRLDATDKRIEEIEKSVVYKDVHAECSRAWHESLTAVDRKLDIIIARMDKK